MSCTLVEEPEKETEMSEPEAIGRAQSGDNTGFAYLYTAHRKRVYIVCLRILRNPHDAEELTQQVFLLALRKIAAFRGEASFSTWLHRVAVNTAVTFLRRRKTDEIGQERSDPEAKGSDGSAELGGSDLSMVGMVDRLNLVRAISQLPADSRRAFLLHDVMGYAHGEIAERVGCSAPCSRLQVHRARKRLRRLL
ncbi:MAG TPA: sigma-70 family RNA polymerase sigma factor [Candidatus Angelobacter sp.]|nr:sigma-70 family RNA polymerase sigma factor [Candidatus Angelobacter sp.]